MSPRENHAMKSTADSVIWGRDMDKSGESLRNHLPETYKGYAGNVNIDRSPRPLRKGQQALGSSPGSVICGRDLNKSGEGIQAQFGQSYAGYAGNLSRNGSPRPVRKHDYAMKSSAEAVIWGRDIADSGEKPHDYCRQSYSGYAGSPSGGRSPRSPRQGEYSMRSTVDEVLFGRDLDRSGEDPHRQFVARFEDHAGMRAVSPRDARRVEWLCVPSSDDPSVARRARSADSTRSREGSTRVPTSSPSPRGRESVARSEARLSVPQGEVGSVAFRACPGEAHGSRHASPRPQQRTAQPQRLTKGRVANSRPQVSQKCERPLWR